MTLTNSFLESKRSFYFSHGKRIFDLFVAVPAIIIFTPVFAIISFMVRVRLGSPVLFKQMRPGWGEKPFAILKYRTMTNDRDGDGNILPDEKRLTRIGAFLRKFSLDELPELFNVLKGDMSIVGPRPLFIEYLPYYSDREHLRHSVRPGITGLSQISGRNYLQWDERLEMDVRYVEEMSFCMDIKIILLTFIQVLKAKDVAVIPGRVSILFSEHRRRQQTNEIQPINPEINDI